MQERHNYSMLAMELRLSNTKPSICTKDVPVHVSQSLNGSMKLFSAEAQMFCKNRVNTMTTNALAPCFIRPSAAIIFTMGDRGTWFNIKMSSYQYRKSHCGDKTVIRSSYIHNGISYTGKMLSLYWIRTQVLISMDKDFNFLHHIRIEIINTFIFLQAIL